MVVEKTNMTCQFIWAPTLSGLTAIDAKPNVLLKTMTVIYKILAV
jgi:hypothetical protein